MRNANASSNELISGCVTISSTVPARLKSIPLLFSRWSFRHLPQDRCTSDSLAGRAIFFCASFDAARRVTDGAVVASGMSLAKSDSSSACPDRNSFCDRTCRWVRCRIRASVVNTNVACLMVHPANSRQTEANRTSMRVRFVELNRRSANIFERVSTGHCTSVRS